MINTTLCIIELWSWEKYLLVFYSQSLSLLLKWFCILELIRFITMCVIFFLSVWTHFHSLSRVYLFPIYFNPVRYSVVVNIIWTWTHINLALNNLFSFTHQLYTSVYALRFVINHSYFRQQQKNSPKWKISIIYFKTDFTLLKPKSNKNLSVYHVLRYVSRCCHCWYLWYFTLIHLDFSITK